MAHAHDAPLPDVVLRVKALESLLTEKGIINPATVDAMVDAYETQVGPRNGAKVVARAWVDADYKSRLLENGSAAVAELGLGGMEAGHVMAVENTPKVHNVVVCTLCSCYPWALLGLPPVWYKSAPFRSRVVREPRSVLREFGTELADDVEVRVWDSSAEMRYLVVPQRPAGTADLSEEQLAELVNRDAMIGTRQADTPN